MVRIVSKIYISLLLALLMIAASSFAQSIYGAEREGRDIMQESSVQVSGAQMDSVQQSAEQEQDGKEQKSGEQESEAIDVQKIIFEHVLDSYDWHIATIGGKHISVPLPVILYSKYSGWHLFSSKKLHHTGSYKNFYPAPIEHPRAGKLLEKLPDGTFVRPLDLSFTKMALALVINSIILLIIILSVARWYRRHEDGSGVPGKFATVVEMVVMTIEDDVIKSCVGKNYRRFSPYLLTVFFFILTCNLMSLIPFFPGGVGVTANMTITMFLALCTFIAVNLFGSKEHWKEVLWPDVPIFLKAPAPIMQIIELVGLLTKPIALMIRLFANMLGGHMAMLVLTILIFIGFSVGKAMGTSMTVISVVFNVFMNALELLVAFLQAYIFTLLSAVFIGNAQIEHEESSH